VAGGAVVGGAVVGGAVVGGTVVGGAVVGGAVVDVVVGGFVVTVVAVVDAPLLLHAARTRTRLPRIHTGRCTNRCRTRSILMVRGKGRGMC
jgi:hypothetical protein